jgi:hypothetical protein
LGSVAMRWNFCCGNPDRDGEPAAIFYQRSTAHVRGT